MRSAGTGTEREETNLGMVLRIIDEDDTTVLVGVPVPKALIRVVEGFVRRHMPFIASLIEAAGRIIRKQ